MSPSLSQSGLIEILTRVARKAPSERKKCALSLYIYDVVGGFFSKDRVCASIDGIKVYIDVGYVKRWRAIILR